VNPKTDADLAFEEYLNGHGHPGFVYEEPLPESLKIPDYQFKWNDVLHLFEVKGFDAPTPAGGGYFDPYPPIRRKITKAVEKFRDLEKYPCSLVLHHAGAGLILLEPVIVLSAMLGEAGFEVPVEIGQGIPADAHVQNVFTKKGKMVRYAKGGRPDKPENTTINAIIVVERYPLGQKLFLQHIKSVECERGSSFPIEEFWDEMQRAKSTEMDVGRHVMRSIVHENPYARIPLDRSLFTGPLDERYGPNDQAEITNVFTGQGIAKLER